MSYFEITDLPDGSFDLHLGAELIGNYQTHRAALRVAMELEGELAR
jgi:hypothetical protein